MLRLDSHYQKLRPILEGAGRSIEQQVPNIAWTIEGGFQSTHYLLTLMLVFVDPRSPEDELAVITVTCSQGPVRRWTIDATGEDSIFLTEETRLSDEDHVRMAEDPDAASAAVEAFIGLTKRLVVESLTRQISGDIPAR